MFLVIGSVTADLLVQSDAPLPQLGDDGFRSSNLVFTQAPLRIVMGGNGGNTAYVLAGLGAPVALGGAVGQDLLGDALIGWLTERGVNLDGLTRSPTHATSTSTILMADAGSQVVFHHLGSTDQARYEEIPPALLAATDVFLATSFPLLTRMRAGGFGRILEAIHSRGGITALDVGPAIGEPVTLAELAPLLPTVAYLLGNTHEIAALTGTDDWGASVAQLLAAGARRVVVKQGEAGSSVWSATERIHVPAFPVTVNISVGAGDSFNAGFLYGVQQGWPLAEALRFGNGVAGLVVASDRGIFDAPSLAAVNALLEASAGSLI
ncbi:MAG: carbohydrate kinase family protein [Chloroflexi bacterium]|nr:MAG: carbohydrate kinase family protein [Chloroflexota bacterium]